jgi:hypothetical protein
MPMPAKKPATTPIPVQLSEMEFSEFIFRGRNAGYPAPPAQIPSTRSYRTGLLPRVMTPNRSSG